ncbi:FBD-associated F-box protein At5g60610-like isoform X1 [Lycium barbarum]|uniref:FBD-associated F-box protein At5g60610-like isoform X1 n=1 Tax=Lycium barbarum TaxID=112863 RepID=UPI00293E0797|nr:FBD-associated F-box protein At5g60610-like isoform X1 [Lycium barbarum]
MSQRRRFMWRNPKESYIHKITITETTEGGQDIACVDRISNLPVDIIRQFLFRIPPKDIARTSVLSKKWLSIWASLSDIYLENGEIGMLFLRMTVDKRSSWELLGKRWIDFALKNKAKTLHLDIKALNYEKPFRLFSLSGFAFSSAILVVLSIKECEISSSVSFMLPNLRSLFLHTIMTVDGFVFADFIAGCPRIEELVVDYFPEELDIILVPNPNLKYLMVKYDALGGKLQVESKKLESLVFSYLRVEVDEYAFEIASTSTVKNLTLPKVYVLERTLSPFINRFPLLENLVIDGCCLDFFSGGVGIDNYLPRLFISHKNLANFVLKLNTTDSIDEIIIHAPNLKSFEYCGQLTSFPGIWASRQLEFVKLHLRPKVLNTRWYIWVRKILESFAHAKHLCLICQSEQDIIFPDELTETLLPAINNIKNLELQIESSTGSTKKILDGFIWILPGLKTLSLTLGSVSKIIEVLVNSTWLLSSP